MGRRPQLRRVLPQGFKCFYCNSDRHCLYSEGLATRTQRDGECFTCYIEDVLLLSRRSNPDMIESEKDLHLIKGISEDGFQFLVAKCSSAASSCNGEAYEETTFLPRQTILPSAA